MNRSHPIVLGVAKAAPPADSATEARQPGMHWRRWRRSGAAISASVHGLLAILLVAGMPQFGAEARKESQLEKKPLDVEIVARPPEPPVEKPPEKAPEIPPVEKPPVEKPKVEIPPPEPPPSPKAAVTPDKPAPPVAKANPQPPPAPAAPPPAAATPPPAVPPSAAAPEAAPRAPPETQWALPQLPPAGDPPPSLAPPPRSAPNPGSEERAADGELVAEPKVIALPNEKKEDKKVEHWVLDPLVVDLREKCGVARIRGVIELTETLPNGNRRGTLRNSTRWAKCPPTETLYRIELRISGIEVTMVTVGGTTDRGVMKGGLMLLEDAYGRSVWRKR